ncbi:hypothetical protein [Bacillus weihaiensis]|nr:hypothetical protein [Bacillus weihaiensis]
MKRFVHNLLLTLSKALMILIKYDCDMNELTLQEEEVQTAKMGF